MLALSLLSRSYTPPPSAPEAYTSTPNPRSTLALSPDDILFFSRRPAILTYTSRLVSLSERLFSLPLYIFGLKRESETLHIPMAESAFFPRGRKHVPAFAMLELQAGQEVQVYDVKIMFKARFEGLRWVMYNHRIISFVAFTAAFWGAEVLFAAVGWLLLRTAFGSKDGKGEVKEEGDGAAVPTKDEEGESDEPDLSDTPRTFPTYGRQAPLRFVPKARDEPVVKDEDSEEYAALEGTGLVDADDEDDEAGDDRRGMTDSGIGTSFSEGGERVGLHRRRSRGGRP